MHLAKVVENHHSNSGHCCVPRNKMEHLIWAVIWKEFNENSIEKLLFAEYECYYCFEMVTNKWLNFGNLIINWNWTMRPWLAAHAINLEFNRFPQSFRPIQRKKWRFFFFLLFFLVESCMQQSSYTSSGSPATAFGSVLEGQLKCW